MQRARTETTFSSKSFIQTTHLVFIQDIFTERKKICHQLFGSQDRFLDVFYILYAFYVETDYGRNLILVFLF